MQLSPFSALLAVFFCLALRFSKPGATTPELCITFFYFQLVWLAVLGAILAVKKRIDLKSAADDLWRSLAILVIVQAVSLLLNGEAIFLNLRFAAWLTVPLYYLLFRSFTDAELAPAAALALPAYLYLSWGTENSNIIAFSVVGLIIIAGRGRVFATRAALLAACPVLVFPLTCRGALIGTFAALLASLKRFPIKKALVVAAGLAVLVVLLDARSASLTHYRDQLFRQAAEKFMSSPIYGHGPNQFYLTEVEGKVGKQAHAHNWVLTVLAESGLLGLAALIFFAVMLIGRWQFLSVWSRMLIAAYLAWSMVDEPLQWWGNNLLFWLAVSRVPASRESDGGKDVDMES